MDQSASADRGTVAATRLTARYSGWGARIIVALTFALFVQLLGLLDAPPVPFDDPAVRNLILLISCFSAGLTLWIWFCFRSSYLRPMRLAVAAVTALAVIAIVDVTAVLGLKGLLQFSGNLTPRLAMREHDVAAFQNRPTAEPDELRADLCITTPDDFSQFLGPT